MDPFLEAPAWFPDLHDHLIARMSETLMACLPAPYFSLIGSRVWVDPVQRPIGPDNKILRGPGPSPTAPQGNGGVAVALTQATLPLVINVPHEEIVEKRIDVYARHEPEDRLVTVIEVLSPTNKTPGKQGLQRYRQKQQEVLASDVHLVEIDLLRDGHHATAVPEDLLRAKAGTLAYHVSIHHFDNLEDYFVYPIRLEEALPAIAIPLLPGDGEVTVDLQAVFTHCYDTGPYRRSVRYAKGQTVPALDPEQTTWMLQLLRQAGMLPNESQA
jgi:hypothetical protein